MAKAAEKVAKGKGSPLSRAREAAMKILKTDDWRVVLDPEQLRQPLPHIPTGSVVIDYLIGGEPNKFGVAPCPGIPRGRITQLWGHEAAGKTTLALTTAASVCMTGGCVLYVDWEHEIVPDYAEALGVPISDPDLFELVQPETLEDGLKIIKAYALAGVDLIVIDSVGAAAPRAIAERDLAETGEQARLGVNARAWSDFLPDIKRSIKRTNAAVLAISQMRAKIGMTGPYGPTAEPQGGHAWKYYSSIRIELRRIKNESAKSVNALSHKKEDRVIGGIIQATMVKCKLSRSQGRKEKFYIRWGDGIDDIRSILEIAVAYNIVKKSGGWMTWKDQRWNGTEVARAYFKDNTDAFKALVMDVRPHLTSEITADDVVEDYSEEGDDILEGLDLEMVED